MFWHKGIQEGGSAGRASSIIIQSGGRVTVKVRPLRYKLTPAGSVSRFLQMAEVALEHLAKVYPNGVEAVRDMNLTVSNGELVVLLGPSGCGKTTTLRLIAGLEEPSTGTISIGGKIMNATAPRRRNVAMVFQKSTLYPHLNVHRNLAFGLQLRQGANRLTRLGLRFVRPARYAE